MSDRLRDLLAATTPAITTAQGLTAAQNLDRAHELAARAELMIEIAEEPARKAAADGEDPNEAIDPDLLGLLYALAAIARTQLALACAKLTEGAR
jgi:hypothetical protein